jgi:hypothetical protein
LSFRIDAQGGAATRAGYIKQGSFGLGHTGIVAQ